MRAGLIYLRLKNLQQNIYLFSSFNLIIMKGLMLTAASTILKFLLRFQESLAFLTASNLFLHDNIKAAQPNLHSKDPRFEGRLILMN